MSKSKKKERRSIPIRGPFTKRPNGVQRDASKKQPSQAKSWLLALLCSVIIILVAAYFIGKWTNDHEGAETPEKLATSFLESMERQDRRKLSMLLLHIDSDYNSMLEALFAYIQSESGITSIDYENIQMDFLDLDAVAEYEDDMGLTGIQQTVLAYLEVPITREKDGGTYNTLTVYYISTFQAKNKWFLYDVVKNATYVISGTDADGNEVDPNEAYRLFNNRFIGGDTEIGVIPLDETWYSLDTDPDDIAIEGVIKDLAYIQETGNALIHMVLIDTDEDVLTLAEQLCDNLSSEDLPVEVLSLKDTIAGYDAYHVSFYDQTSDVFFFSWLVDTKEYDGYVRYLSVESNGDYQAACVYVTSFVTPDQYYDMIMGVSYEDDTTDAEAKSE